MRSPVLFLVFNRPDTTKQVFDAIRQAQPPRLYVAADGPRPDRAGESERCEEVRQITSAVDWPCEVSTLIRAENLGCKRAVSSAIKWFFEHEAEGIVLEDDCLPDASFFPYCDALLERYRNDPSVMCLSGDNFISRHWSPDESYYFSRYPHIWGWASWRRAWDLYDVNMLGWTGADGQNVLGRMFPGQGEPVKFWRRVFDRVSSGRIDTWDYQWTYACWLHGGLTCIPENNLISNIGFGYGATHTVSPESKLANLATSSLSMPLRHPVHVAATASADRWTSANVFDINEAGMSFARWRRAVRAKLAEMVSRTVGRG